MASELDGLRAASGELAGTAATRYPEIAVRAERLEERLAKGRFHVSVLGEFKRGKSTFINALLGRELLPTGVLPLTAVSTEVAFGDPGAVVVHLDGTRTEVGLDDLADYVTEARNPENERQVQRVEAMVPVPLLEPGVVLVDTPGIGSIYLHNTEAARNALLDADGAVLVLSADAPLSDQERELLASLAERQAPTFFVLNKVDHLSPDERDEVRRFVAEAVAAELGRKETLYCLAARPALEARLRAKKLTDDAGDFPAFEADLHEFIARDLVDARLAAARRELGRLGRELSDAVGLEASSLAVDAETLASRVEEFRLAATHERQAMADERTLLTRDAGQLAKRIGDDLYRFAAAAPAKWRRQLEDVARSAPVADVEDQLRAVVEQAVVDRFEVFRQQEADYAEESWAELAERYRYRTEERVNAVRTAAADLFDVQLPRVTVPEVAEERERFFYLFLHVGSSSEAIGRLGRRLLPSSLVRRRMLAQAQRHLTQEFDKHAGRARWDLTQRLEAVRQRFEKAMAAELERTIDAILAAAERAEGLRRSTEVERKKRSADAAAVLDAATRALDLGAGA